MLHGFIFKALFTHEKEMMSKDKRQEKKTRILRTVYLIKEERRGEEGKNERTVKR